VRSLDQSCVGHHTDNRLPLSMQPGQSGVRLRQDAQDRSPGRSGRRWSRLWLWTELGKARAKCSPGGFRIDVLHGMSELTSLWAVRSPPLLKSATAEPAPDSLMLTKPFDQITADDIRDLYARGAYETQLLEFKSELPAERNRPDPWLTGAHESSCRCRGGLLAACTAERSRRATVRKAS